MKSKNNISKLLGALIIIFALTFSTSSYASGSDDHSSDSSDSNSYERPKGDKIPLDGGLSVLLLGAAAFGVKKLRDNKK
jgi:hypothetical protein